MIDVSLHTINAHRRKHEAPPGATGLLSLHRTSGIFVAFLGSLRLGLLLTLRAAAVVVIAVIVLLVTLLLVILLDLLVFLLFLALCILFVLLASLAPLVLLVYIALIFVLLVLLVLLVVLSLVICKIRIKDFGPSVANCLTIQSTRSFFSSSAWRSVKQLPTKVLL